MGAEEGWRKLGLFEMCLLNLGSYSRTALI